MITRIRDVRRAKGLTLSQVGALCVPTTSAQTIGRLETGTRTVSVGWLNRIAAALDVSSADLVDLQGEQSALPVAALLGPEGARAPTRPLVLPAPSLSGEMVGVQVRGSIGDYRVGDELWCRRIAPVDFAEALNRDMLLPQATGRFLFGRLIERLDGALRLLPLGARAAAVTIPDPLWGAVAQRLVRLL
ncbi:MAG: helix-turn-helix transcriptional regulator [Sphingobium sp.]